MRRRVYVTQGRLQAIAKLLSDRQWAILEDVIRLNIVSGDQLRRLHYEHSEAGRRLLRKDLAQLIEWQVLARLSRTIGGERAGSSGHVYRLGVSGKRLRYPDRRRYRQPWTPLPSHLLHALAVSDLFVRLHERDRTDGWSLVHFDAEPACWRRYSGPGGANLILKPDAFTLTENDEYEDRAFIEIDRATEALPRITEKAKAYVRYWQSGREQEASGLFPRVLWVVPDQARLAQLVDRLILLPAEHWQLFAVATSATAAEQIMTGAITAISAEMDKRREVAK
jgi:hypothetical protein